MNSTSRPCSPSSNSSARASNFQTASFLPRFTFPSPLVGEGRVGGREATLHSSTPARHLSTPTPNPSPQGGGERAASASTQRKSILATPARPSYANAIRKQLPRSRIASRLNRRWDRLSARSCSSVLFEHDLFGKPVSTFPDHARQTKGKRNAGRRISPTSAPYGRGSRSAERARLPAFHHGTCCSDRTPQLSSSTRFLGRN